MKIVIIFALTLALAWANASSFTAPDGGIESESFVAPVVEGRITNGNSATVGQFPYQVGLSLKINFFTTSWCGGSLIDRQWVLTAAHCTDGVRSATVYLGATVRTKAKVTYTVTRDNIIIHSGWDRKTVTNDISLIKIPSVALSSSIQIVKLPASASSYSTYNGNYVLASGWGKISDSATGVTDDLQWARMQVISNNKCRLTYAATITESIICVSTPGGVSTCSGDSGGPLVLESSRIQIGLTSFGRNACAKGYPAAFTRLTSYLSWIHSHTGIAY